MTPVRIEGATRALGKPANWDDDAAGSCSALWVRTDVEGGVAFMFSAWEADPAELLCLLAGAKVRLGVAAPAHPVVNLGVGPLPEDFASPLIVERVMLGTQPAVRVQMLLADQRRGFCTVAIGPDGLGAAIKAAVDGIERFASDEGAAQ